ncbi:hypothetical protein ACK2J6_001184 [Vibrio fluvialis]
MNITITGSVLRDKTDSSKRNYVNLVLSAKKGEGSLFYHITNWQANAKSNVHRMKLNEFTSFESAMESWNDTQKRKLDRDRIEHKKVMEEFTDLDEMEKSLTDTLYRFTIVNVRKLKNKITNEIDQAAEEAELSFDERMERRLEEAEDFSVLEREAGVGKETAAMTGSNWGMF